jgi:hypothetical protein
VFGPGHVAIQSCTGFTQDAAYAAIDFLLDALGEIAGEVFSSVVHLLNLGLRDGAGDVRLTVDDHLVPAAALRPRLAPASGG